jgi:hypothetical protein
MTGAHPTLSGGILGLMTPVVFIQRRERPLDVVSRVVNVPYSNMAVFLTFPFPERLPPNIPVAA